MSAHHKGHGERRKSEGDKRLKLPWYKPGHTKEVKDSLDKEFRAK